MAEIRYLIEPKYLYRYRSLNVDHLDKEIAAITEGYLWFSDFEHMNDPMEGAYENSALLRKKEKSRRD